MSASPKLQHPPKSNHLSLKATKQHPKVLPSGKDMDGQDGSKFRVVSHAGNRYAFKLETVFWQILQLAADGKKMRIGAYIADILQSDKKTENKTSTLRTHAAEWLCRQLYEATSKMISPRMLGKVVAASPVPALAMDAQNRIVGQNTPFLDLLSNQLGDRDISELGTIRVKFARDISAVKSSQASLTGPYANETIQIRSDLGEWSFQSRVVNIQSTQGNSIGLLLFITN